MSHRRAKKVRREERQRAAPWWYDGAHSGMTASQCVKVLRAGAPMPATRMTKDQMRVYLETAPDDVSLDRYQDEGLGELLNQAAEMTPAEFRRAVPAGPDGLMAAFSEGRVQGVGESSTYEMVARCAGRRMLAHMEAHPHVAMLFVDCPFIEGVPEPYLDHAFRDAGVVLEPLQLTGFQYGWAANAAKFVLGLPPVPNPSLTRLPASAITRVQENLRQSASSP